MDSGRTACYMGKVHIRGQMVEFTQVNLKKIKNMDKELINGPTAKSTMEAGLKANNTVRHFSLIRKVKHAKEDGNRAKEKSGWMI